MDLAIGIDLGGTTIKGALVRESGEIIHPKSVSTPQSDRSEFLRKLIQQIDFFFRKGGESNRVLGIGVGVPGNIHPETGRLEGIPNIAHLSGFALLKELEKQRNRWGNLSLYMENDANNAAQGEYLFGGAKGEQNFLFVTLGTGVGGGLILNGKLFPGFMNYAGEIGHVIMVPKGRLCRCGNYGCLEAYSSVPSLIAQLEQAVLKGLFPEPDSKSNVNGKMIAELARSGNLICREILHDCAYYLGIAISNVLDILNLPLVLIGGGLSAAGDLLIPWIHEITDHHVIPSLKGSFRTLKSELGNDAGILGSASNVFIGERLKQKEKS